MGWLLAGLGADVIKIEPPGGNETRQYGPFYQDQPVGNQHKWDRLGPEKIIIMKSCVGAP